MTELFKRNCDSLCFWVLAWAACISLVFAFCGLLWALSGNHEKEWTHRRGVSGNTQGDFAFSESQSIGGCESARIIVHGDTGKAFIVVSSLNAIAIAPIEIEPESSDDDVPAPKIEAVSSWPERR